MRRRVLAMVLGTAMMVGTLAGCGTGSFDSSSSTSSSTAAEATSEAAETEETTEETADTAEAAGYTGDSYTLQLGHIGADGSIEDTVSNRFAELVNEKSDGKIEVTVFGNAQMGGLNDLVDAIRYDTLDFALFAAGNLESYDAAGTILGLPYLFSSYEHVEAFYQTDEWAQIREQLAEETNCLALADFHTGFRDILSNVEITSPDDMVGLAIRVPEAPSFVKTFGALGCNTTTLPASDVYQALQTGLVEATEAAPSYMQSMNYQDVSTYCIKTNHIYTGNSIYISKSKFESLDEAAQAVIQEAATEAANEVLDTVEEQDEAAFAVFEEVGVQMVDPDLDAFKEKMTEVWGELFINNVENGQAIVDAALACDPS